MCVRPGARLSIEARQTIRRDAVRGAGRIGGTMLVPPLVIAAGQLLSIVFVIATYRAARASKDGNGPMKF